MRRVAITGMGIVSGIGNDVDSFKNNLFNGVCGIDYITRFDTEGFKVKIACEVKDFDPYKYMDKNDVRKSDLYTQYAMSAAGQAIADSNISGNISPERFGVYFGSGIGGMNTFSSETEKLLSRGPSRVSPFFIPMMIVNIAAGNIAIKYGAKGPSLAVVTACATSTNAIGEAFRAIKHGYCDAVIAGGSEAAVHPLAVAGFTNCMALSNNNNPKEACRPFDKLRDGFIIGEGAGAVILEEYEHAKKRNAVIYAEICGYGNTCDAYHVTAPAPDAEMPALAITNALHEAGMENEEHIYINAHGTSTPMNDKTETAAIKKALGERAYKALVSSTKSMTGHMLGAAGAAEAIASVLALNNQTAPPTVGYTEKDDDCDLDYIPNTARRAKINLALSTSLGFGGHNACLALKLPD